MSTTARRIGASVLAAVMLTALAGAPALAKDGDGRVTVRGDCSARTDWKLKAKPDDGALQVEFEVDSNRIGQRWTWSIRHDGTVVASGRRTTLRPSGSFSVERTVRDAPGTHRISATARNLRTGETCRASLRV
jgi:hypothetical protein